MRLKKEDKIAKCYLSSVYCDQKALDMFLCRVTDQYIFGVGMGAGGGGSWG